MWVETAEKVNRPFGAAVMSLIASFSVQGLLQVIILVIGVFAAIEAYRRNKSERLLAEAKIKKLRKQQ